MIKKIIQRLLSQRHFWREIGFDELGELYTSMMFRNTALSLVGIFVPIYLYNLGLSVGAILTFFAVFFTVRVWWDLFAGFTVARFGPKHTLLFSYLLQVLALFMFTTYQQFYWPLYLIAVVWGGANSFFYVAFHTDFSKIKHPRHGGKELGYMSIVERTGILVGPLLGGVVASLYGIEYTFLVATACFGLGTIPLLLTGESVKVRQKLDFKGLSTSKIRRDLFAYTALGVENTICMLIWPLFLALFVVVGKVYAQVGLLVSASAIVAVFAARAIGSVTDNYKGRALLRYSAVANAALHGLRPMINAFTPALLVNVANEAVTVGYRLPFFKGMYDAADDLPGHRIVYITSMEMLASMGKAMTYWFLTFMALMLGTHEVLSLAFVVAAVASLLVMSERFKALDTFRKHK